MSKHWLRSEYGFKRDKWYEPYESLNEMLIPPAETLLQIQKESICRVNKNKKAEINQLNTFLNGLQQHYKDLGNEEEFFSIFLKTINQGYMAFQAHKPKPSIPEFLNRYENNLKEFVDIIAAYSGQRVPDNILSHIKDLQKRVTTSEANFYAFRQRKADFWEDIATWVLSLAGFSPAKIGNIVDEAGKQLISDAVGFLQDSFINTDNKNSNNDLLSISMRITGTESKKGNAPLLDILKDLFPEQSDSIKYGKNNWISVNIDPSFSGFENLLEKTQHSVNHKVTVKINDTTVQNIEKGLTVQAKSGFNQGLLNKQKRNLISQSQLFAWDTYLKTATEFYNNYNYDDKVENGTSDTLNAYINWVFSKNLMNTPLGKNDIYLSSHGFSTLDQQLERSDTHYALMPDVRSLKLLSTTETYTIESVVNK